MVFDMDIRSVLVFLFTAVAYALAIATPLDGSTPTQRQANDATSLELRQLGGPPVPASMCATEILCCDSVTYASDPSTAQLLALLGINVGGLYTVGIDCSPIAFVGAGTGSCSALPVCCWWGAQYAYEVAIDCEPIDLNE